jgi:hypothetical protein
MRSSDGKLLKLPTDLCTDLDPQLQISQRGNWTLWIKTKQSRGRGCHWYLGESFSRGGGVTFLLLFETLGTRLHQAKRKKTCRSAQEQIRYPTNYQQVFRCSSQVRSTYCTAIPLRRMIAIHLTVQWRITHRVHNYNYPTRTGCTMHIIGSLFSRV